MLTTPGKPEKVADLLIDRIIQRGLRPGDNLGTEAELLEETGVSRPTLREALKILQVQHLVRLRQGPRGGTIVDNPGSEGLARQLSLLMRLNGASFSLVLETRQVIEPALAHQAAMRARPNDIEALRASIERMEQNLTDEDLFVEENRTFHHAIAQASGNEILEVVWQALSVLAEGQLLGVTYSEQNRRHVLAAHRRILTSCEERRPQVAAAEMQSHVRELEDMVHVKFPHLVDDATVYPSRDGEVAPADSAEPRHPTATRRDSRTDGTSNEEKP